MITNLCFLQTWKGVSRIIKVVKEVIDLKELPVESEELFSLI